MSQHACVVDGKRIRGPAHVIYTALVQGAFSSRKASRYCSDHVVPASNRLAQLGQLVWLGDDSQLDDGDVPDTCRQCPAYGAWTLYVDSYIRGEPERAYRARYCEDHVGPVALEARVAL